MRLRQRLTLTFLLMLVVPFVAVTILQVDRTINVMVSDLGQTGDLVIGQIFEQIRTDLAKTAAHPIAALSADPQLGALLRSSQAFGRGVVYSSVETLDGKSIAGALANNVMPARSFTELQRGAASWWPWAPVAAVWGANTYELNRVVQIGDKPLAVIRIGVSTALIATEARRSVSYTIAVGLAGIALALAGAMLVSGLVREPLTALVSSVEDIASDGEEIAFSGGDELEGVVEKFSQLAARIKMNRLRWQAERRQFFTIFHSITDSVLLLDASGAVLFANSEAQERLSLPAGGLSEGKSLKLLLGSDNPLIRAIETASATGIEVRDVALDLAAGRDPQRLLVSVSLLGHGPEPPGMLVVARDLKPVRELESVVEHSGRLARLGSLISGVAHQLRNPLNAMSLQLELLSHEFENDAPAAKRVRALRDEIERLDKAIEALLRFMRPEPLKPSSLHLNTLLSEVAASVKKPEVRVDSDFDLTIPAIHADRALLAEALRNIVSNAVEAMPNGGHLRIGSQRLPDGFVEIRITDNGEGIAPQDIERVFNLYFTTKKGGSGLGLPLALRAVDLHQGTIEVDSKPGGGTTVRVRLPIGDEETAMAQRATA